MLKLIVILFAVKVSGYVFDKIKQPRVLGELIVGVLLGPSLIGFITGHEEILLFLSEIGVIILLFLVGLESNVHELLKSGKNALLVALIGVIAPVMLSLPYLLYLEAMDFNVALFVGATLTATSVGVTMRVLSEMKKITSIEGKIILGAAVIDDVLGLIILSVLGGIAETGSVELFGVAWTIFLAVAFLAVTVIVGTVLEEPILRLIRYLKVQRTFIVTAIVFALALGYLAQSIGLAAIVGAFAAGLVLEREEHKEHIMKKAEVIGDVFTPIFFVMAGVVVNVYTISADLIPLAVILLLIALIGKIVAGIGAFGSGASKTAVGVGMIPRGEVGLIFATFGLAHNLVGEGLYSVLVVVIMLTTLVTPPVLKKLMENK
jgi:Kef-type K+ transport system membrane component KefB